MSAPVKLGRFLEAQQLPLAAVSSSNGHVVCCTWRRCWLTWRPVSGRCRDCSQHVLVEADALTGYERVVEEEIDDS